MQAFVRDALFSHTGKRVVLYLTGAGMQSVGWLLTTPGASSCMLQVDVPYHQAAFDDLMGVALGQHYVSGLAARTMARRAYLRASELVLLSGSPLMELAGMSPIGVGCTGALATSQPKKGEHRCFVSAWTNKRVVTIEVIFVKGHNSREGEDDLASRIILRSLFGAFNETVESEKKEEDCAIFPTAWMSDSTKLAELGISSISTHIEDHKDQQLERLLMNSATESGKEEEALLKKVSSVLFLPTPEKSALVDVPLRGYLILPGSFNPFHHGHLTLGQRCLELFSSTKKGLIFELTAENPDKPTLTEMEIMGRVSQFTKTEYPIVVTRAPLFSQKSVLFKGCTFIVGVDTAVRLVDEKYYSASKRKMMESLMEIRENGCNFLVAGRFDAKRGSYAASDSFPIPVGLESLFTCLKESDFRIDISSTEIRAGLLSASSAASTATTDVSTTVVGNSSPKRTKL